MVEPDEFDLATRVEPGEVDLATIVEPDQSDLASIGELDKVDLVTIVEPDEVDLATIVEPDEVDLATVVELDKVDRATIVEPDEVDLATVVEPDKSDLTTTAKPGTSKLVAYLDFKPEVHMKKVDENNWYVGGVKITRSSPPSPLPASCIAHWIDDVDNSSYTLCKALPPKRKKWRHRDGKHIKLETSPQKRCELGALWSIGTKVVLKVEFREETTPERIIMEYVRNQRPQYFHLPRVLYHTSDGKTSFCFQELPGRSIRDAWQTLSGGWRVYYSFMILAALFEMATWKGDTVGGLAGKCLGIPFLTTTKKIVRPTNHIFTYKGVVVESLEELGLDTSVPPVFGLTLLSALTVRVEETPSSGKIWFVNWESAGFAPRAWVRTSTWLQRSWRYGLPDRELYNLINSGLKWAGLLSVNFEHMVKYKVGIGELDVVKDMKAGKMPYFFWH